MRMKALRRFRRLRLVAMCTRESFLPHPKHQGMRTREKLHLRPFRLAAMSMRGRTLRHRRDTGMKERCRLRPLRRAVTGMRVPYPPTQPRRKALCGNQSLRVSAASEHSVLSQVWSPPLLQSTPLRSQILQTLVLQRRRQILRHRKLPATLRNLNRGRQCRFRHRHRDRLPPMRDPQRHQNRNRPLPLSRARHLRLTRAATIRAVLTKRPHLRRQDQKPPRTRTEIRPLRARQMPQKAGRVPAAEAVPVSVRF